MSERTKALESVAIAAQRMLNDFEREFGLFRDIEDFGRSEVRMDDVDESAVLLRDALDRLEDTDAGR